MSIFGQKQPASTPAFGSGFGQVKFGTPTTQQTSLFGGQQTTTVPSAGTLFSTPATSSQPLFGGGSSSFFSAPQSTAASTGGFNFSTITAPKPTVGFFNQPQQQIAQPQIQQQSGVSESIQSVVQALSGPTLYNDERDQLVSKLNQLQAMCGCGKGYFAPGAQPVDFNTEGPFCRFKAIGYNRLQTFKDSDGLVGLIIKRPPDQVSSNRQLVVDGLREILGNKPNIITHVEVVKPLPNDTCEVIVYVTEKSPTGAQRRIVASELNLYLSQTNVKQLLQTKLAVEMVFAKTDLDSTKQKEYLATPPAGIDQLVWQQAQKDNPDSSQLIPWPIRGFEQLTERQQMQLQETQLQETYLKELSDRIGNLEQKTTGLDTRIAQQRASHDQLTHRLLKVLSVQLVRQRLGYALDQSEETLQGRLEALNAQLNAPAQIKGRLSELLSVVRCQPELLAKSVASTNQNDVLERNDDLRSEVERYLKKYQQGLESLVEIVNNDLSDLNTLNRLITTTNR